MAQNLKGKIDFRGPLLIAYLTAITACWVALEFYFENIPWTTVLVYHGLTSLALLFWFVNQYKKREDARFSGLTLFLSLFLGPLGAGSAALCLTIVFLYRHRIKSFSEWYDALFPEHIKNEAAELLAELDLKAELGGEEGEITPFINLMQHGDTQQKRKALSLMATQFDPAYADVIMLGLQDSENAIRVQTANIMAQLENQFYQKSYEMEKQLEKAPEDTTLLLALAHHFDDYAFTGLLDPERESKNREKAIELYQQYLVLFPQQTDVRLKIGRVLLRSKRYPEAQVFFENAVTQEPENTGYMIWYLETLFICRDFEKLRTLVTQHKHRLIADETFSFQVKQAIYHWA